MIHSPWFIIQKVWISVNKGFDRYLFHSWSVQSVGSSQFPSFRSGSFLIHDSGTFTGVFSSVLSGAEHSTWPSFSIVTQKPIFKNPFQWYQTRPNFLGTEPQKLDCKLYTFSVVVYLKRFFLYLDRELSGRQVLRNKFLICVPFRGDCKIDKYFCNRIITNMANCVNYAISFEGLLK